MVDIKDEELMPSGKKGYFWRNLMYGAVRKVFRVRLVEPTYTESCEHHVFFVYGPLILSKKRVFCVLRTMRVGAAQIWMEGSGKLQLMYGWYWYLSKFLAVSLVGLWLLL